jgi:hypothetical protein
VAAKETKDTSPTAVTHIRMSKVGLLTRKDDLLEGGKKGNWRKWKQWTVILTGSQLLFFVCLSAPVFDGPFG